MRTHIIRAKLMPEKRTYRDIEIPSSRSLSDLAETVVAAFDFDMDHAFGFYDDLRNWTNASVRYEAFVDMGLDDSLFDRGPKAQSCARTKLYSALPRVKQKLLFLYDYGDEWRFEIEVRGFGERAGGAGDPRIVAAKGESPEQYPDPDDEDWDDEEDLEENDEAGDDRDGKP